MRGKRDQMYSLFQKWPSSRLPSPGLPPPCSLVITSVMSWNMKLSSRIGHSNTRLTNSNGMLTKLPLPFDVIALWLFDRSMAIAVAVFNTPFRLIIFFILFLAGLKPRPSGWQERRTPPWLSIHRPEDLWPHCWPNPKVVNPQCWLKILYLTCFFRSFYWSRSYLWLFG